MLGIMLVNTGTADEPTEESIRAYLRVFLSDRHLVDLPPALWNLVLNLFILPHRPRKTLARYQEFWTPEGSPFTLTCQAQRDIVEQKLHHLLDEPFMVRIAMRYSKPFIGDVLQELADAKCERIIVLPMYPQWTVPCAGTILDEFDDEYAARFGGAQDGTGAGPQIIKIREYWNEPGYIQALAASISRAWTHHPGAKLIMSFHSIPLSYVSKFHDTYLDTTAATLEAVGRVLGIPEQDRAIAFQSRFDNRTWAGPFLLPTVQQFATLGVSDIAVVSPIFSVECIETHFETNLEVKEAFEEAARAAGTRNPRFTYVPALGTDDAFMDVVANLIANAARTSS